MADATTAAPKIVPAFLAGTEPGTWDTLTLLAATIFLEAEGEPQEGKLAVGWVIRNRADQWALSVPVVILGADRRAYGDGHPFEQFSCWNDDYRAQASVRLAKAGDVQLEQAWRAAAAAYWRLIPDPIAGACFYLNVESTKAQRGGTLPSWAALPGHPTDINTAKVVGVIGRHTFVKA